MQLDEQQIFKLLNDIDCIRCAVSNLTSGGSTPSASQFDKEVSYVPSITNVGFYDKIVHTWVNGVAQPDVTITTKIPITSAPPASHDFEYVCDLSTGFLQEIDKLTNANGSVTTTITPTTIVCRLPIDAPRKSTNGFTMLNSANPIFDLSNPSIFGDLKSYVSLSFTGLHLPNPPTDAFIITDSYGNITTWADPDHLPSFSYEDMDGINPLTIQIQGNAEGVLVWQEKI